MATRSSFQLDNLTNFMISRN